MAFPQPAPAFRLRLRIAPVVLLWLALLLVTAQTIAVLHAYTHAPGEPSPTSQGKHTGGLAHCHSCIVAATVGGGAPPTATLPLLAIADHQLASFTLAVERCCPQNRPYAIRAPPVIVT